LAYVIYNLSGVHRASPKGVMVTHLKTSWRLFARTPGICFDSGRGSVLDLFSIRLRSTFPVWGKWGRRCALAEGMVMVP